MYRFAALAAATLLTTPALEAQQADTASFVTLLGVDTLAVERFVVTDRRMEAETVLRSPRTTYGRYVLEMDPGGQITRYEGTVGEGADAQGEPMLHESVERAADGFAYQRGGARSASGTFTADAPVFPFIDMVHWPFELMLRRTHAMPAGEIAQPLFSGGRVIPFVVINRGGNEFGVRHPTRGTMDVVTDDRGRMMSLDAGRTTRALTVHRGAWMDLPAIARSFASRDGQGRSFGDLSGRGEEHATVHGAAISVDFGTPQKRGRDIFGGLLPWGVLWRTGANQATHFTTDRDLVMGELTVPAGTYTLFTIPEEDGGTLMINKRTGINGQQYDADQDLGHVAMTRSTGGETVEVFTIRVRETPQGGVLELLWDRDIFSVPFQVR